MHADFKRHREEDQRLLRENLTSVVYPSARALTKLAKSVSMGSQAAAHFAHLRRLAFTKEVQQMAFTFVKYGSAVYCFRTYVMALTAVTFDF